MVDFYKVDIYVTVPRASTPSAMRMPLPGPHPRLPSLPTGNSTFVVTAPLVFSTLCSCDFWMSQGEKSSSVCVPGLLSLALYTQNTGCYWFCFYWESLSRTSSNWFSLSLVWQQFGVFLCSWWGSVSHQDPEGWFSLWELSLTRASLEFFWNWLFPQRLCLWAFKKHFVGTGNFQRVPCK